MKLHFRNIVYGTVEDLKFRILKLLPLVGFFARFDLNGLNQRP
jgi:hypothetical protein